MGLLFLGQLEPVSSDSLVTIGGIFLAFLSWAVPQQKEKSSFVTHITMTLSDEELLTRWYSTVWTIALLSNLFGFGFLLLGARGVASTLYGLVISLSVVVALYAGWLRFRFRRQYKARVTNEYRDLLERI